MGELRAYALGVSEVGALAGAGPAQRDHLRTLARRAGASSAWRPTLRGAVGPIYRRVPGQRVVTDDEPTPADLDALLAGGPVPPGRAAATWRLVETLVAALAGSSTRLPDAHLPPGLLSPLPLRVPAADGLTTGWCTFKRAGVLTGLHAWLAGAGAAPADVGDARRPAPDVVVFATAS